MTEPDLSVETTLVPFNEMMSPDGSGMGPLAGIPKRTGVGLSGRPESGKTTLVYQLAFEYAMQAEEGMNALFLDTEGSQQTYWIWKDRLADRYGLDVSLVEVEPVFDGDGQWQKFRYERDLDADHQFFRMDVRDLRRILTLHGRPARIETEDGKMKLAPNGPFPNDIANTPIGEFVFNNDVEFLAYDSITNPLETFTNRQQDRPTRAKATAWWLLQAQALAEQKDMIQFYITHLSKNPTNPYDRPDILGGKNVKHQIKYSIYLQEKSDNIRQMRLFRHPGKEPWTDTWSIELQDGGYVSPS